jgi:hypothetical protein
MGGNARIGFHAAGDKTEVSSYGNAVIGAYLYELGITDFNVIIHLTKASPYSMTWLTMADAIRWKIDAKAFSFSQDRWSWAKEAQTGSGPPRRIDPPTPVPATRAAASPFSQRTQTQVEKPAEPKPPQQQAGRASPEPSAAAIEPKVPEVHTAKVQVHPVEKPAEAAAQYVTGSVVAPRAVVEAVPVVAEQLSASALARRFFPEMPPADAQAHHNDLIAQASRRVENGDVAGAREMLAAAEDGSQGLVSFALAETYDPNMLAAWGTRGVAGDIARARALYRKALDLGVASAYGRLEALK